MSFALMKLEDRVRELEQRTAALEADNARLRARGEAMSYSGSEPCANCEHPLRQHPPDEPCCKRCSGWTPVTDAVSAQRIAALAPDGER
jgi:hypothetical protein